MSSRFLVNLSFVVCALCILVCADADLGKRSAVLESRQTCSTPGWIPACPGLFKCIPPGGICCSDGIHYAMPPRTCPDGTQPVATAPLSSEAITITTPPAPTSTVAQYTWYTAEFTWYYWYYYYTYIAVYQTTRFTSSYVTTVTTVSLTATDQAQATALFSSLKATLSYPTPTQTVTPTNGYTLPSSYPTTTIIPSGTGTINATNTPPIFTGAANAMAVNLMGPTTSVFAWVLGFILAAPGLLMMWL